MEEKQQPYPQCPSGLPAVENSLALLLDQANRGCCTIEQVVKWMCSEPARIWNLKKQRAAWKSVSMRDLVLVDMNRKQTILNEEQQTKSRWSPWHGTELTGWPIATWVMGQQVFDARDGQPKFNESLRGHEIEFCV